MLLYSDLGKIDRTDVEKISSTRPIILLQRSGHEGWLNGKALEKLGFTAENTKGNPDIDFAKGHFVESAMIQVLMPKMLPLRTYMIAEPRIPFEKGGAEAARAYTDSHQGEWITPPDELNKIITIFYQQSYPIHIHVNGDDGIDSILATFAELKKAFPDSKSRVFFHHVGYARPEERISVFDAMKAITLGSAYTLGMENEIGSIKAGKKTDFTILAEDPFKIDPMKICDIKIIGKFFNGKYYELRK